MGQMFCSNVPIELMATGVFFSIVLAVVFGQFVYDRFFMFLDEEDEALIDQTVDEIVERHEAVTDDGRSS